MNFLNVTKNKGGRVKTPTVLQMEATECGAASLAMILAYYDSWIPLEKLREECGVNRDGSKASNIMRAAKNRGMEVHGYRWMAENLREEAKFPLIVFWEFNHFLVLEGIIDEKVYLNDPAVGRRTVDWDEFLASYTGIAITLEPGETFKREGKKYSPFKTLIKKLLQDKKGALFFLFLGICMVIPGIAAPVMTRIYLDEIFSGKHIDWLQTLCLAMTVAFIVSGVLTWLRASLLTRWERKFTLLESSKFFRHLLNLPMKFFHQRYAAEVAGRVNLNASVSKSMLGGALGSIFDFFAAIFFLILLFSYNPLLTVIGLCFTIINIAVLIFARKTLKDLSMRIEQDDGKEYGFIINSLSMIDTIKANGQESEIFAKWAGYRSKVLAATQEYNIKLKQITYLPTLLTGLNGAIIITFGGFSIIDGAMTAGMFVAFQRLMENFQKPIKKCPKIFSDFQAAEIQMQRLNDVMSYERDKLNDTETKKNIANVPDRLYGELILKDISFGYSPLEAPFISDFSLKLNLGRWVAIVGASGSGKSTVAKIITGLYAPWEGKVLFDGKSREELPKSVISSSFAAVSQDSFLISGTVWDNIAFFDKSLKQSDIIQAAKDALIHEYILKLDGGYEARIEEGGLNFSGGQCQRLEIARALAINPALLVLDEATSALDPVTEEKIFENIRHRGSSCVIVAHRLSTIRDCDEIIVLDNGKIVERGRHSDLMVKNGVYAKLVEEWSNT